MTKPSAFRMGAEPLRSAVVHAMWSDFDALRRHAGANRRRLGHREPAAEAPFRVIKAFQGPSPDKDFPKPPELADFDMAAGFDSILAVSNFGIGLYTKSGNLLEYQTIQNFFRPALINEYESYYSNSQVEDGEIRSLYDPLSERYFIVASTALGECNINECISYFMLAVSKSD